jgi:hypothetical protein
MPQTEEGQTIQWLKFKGQIVLQNITQKKRRKLANIHPLETVFVLEHLVFVLERLVFVLEHLDFHTTCLKRKISKDDLQS